MSKARFTFRDYVALSDRWKSPFWIVWNPKAGTPIQQHWTLESAEREADRLARKHGQLFVVLRSVCDYMCANTYRTPHHLGEDGRQNDREQEF